MMIDFHIHANTSKDSEISPKAAYETASSKGIKNICILCHHEPSESRKGDFKQSLTEEKLKNYISEVSALKKQGKLNLFTGVEMGYDEDGEDDIKDFIRKNQFDFVLGSIHHMKDIHFGYFSEKERLKDRNHKEIISDYFKILKKAINTGMFDVIAHIDIYKRVLPMPDFEDVRKEWEEVGEILASKGVGFEINTSHTKDVPGGTYPEPEIIKILLDKGVKIITIGSDAHHPEHIGRGIEDVEKLLKKLGVERVYVFDKREPRPLGL